MKKIQSVVTLLKNYFRTIFGVLRASSGRALENPARRSCELQGKSYPHGTEIMAEAKILACVDGVWQEWDNPFFKLSI